VLDLNLRTPFLLTQAFLPLLEPRASAEDPSRVINVGSIERLRVPAWPSFSYSSSKAGLHQLTRHLARDLGPRHLTVNAIVPGPFPSKMMAAMLDQEGEAVVASAPLAHRAPGRHRRPDGLPVLPGGTLRHRGDHPAGRRDRAHDLRPSIGTRTRAREARPAGRLRPVRRAPCAR
jgi:NAD(P)-dependent dehydrogenase (short-subunit alcohol dehydrogenase family)